MEKACKLVSQPLLCPSLIWPLHSTESDFNVHQITSHPCPRPPGPEGQGSYRGRRPGPVALTDGHATVGATEVDVALRDGRHANLIEGPREEGPESTAEGHCPVACGTAHRNTDLGSRRGQRQPRRGGTGEQGAQKLTPLLRVGGFSHPSD